MEKYKVLPKRLINKYMDKSFSNDGVWNVNIVGKDCVTVYVRDIWGRLLIYSRNYSNGKVEHSHGYKMWNDDVLYHVHKGMVYSNNKKISWYISHGGAKNQFLA